MRNDPISGTGPNLTRRDFVAALAAGLGLTARPGSTPAASLITPIRTATAPKPFGPLPSARQLRWHRRDLYGFLHFTVNTFTDKEWGYGDESPAVFAPTDFDANQIVGTARDAGMRGLILTCKHHDGFCLWPSKLTEHSVRNSPWRGGRGDVVREVSDACRRHGLGFGVYLSPWDRNHKDYGRPEYLSYYRGQLRELLTGYGPIFEVWFDGANGGEGYYGGARETRRIDRDTYYDWQTTWRLVRELQPDAMMFSDAGPDVRWVGNERGIAGETCWATLDRDEFAPGRADEARLNRGDRPGTHWLPAECDVSIRPGWFHHASEDDKVKSPRDLVDLYYASVGRGASLLLNMPPDRRGRIPERDARVLREFHRLIAATFSTNLATGAKASASNARAGARYAARSAVDGRRDTYWATDDRVTEADLTVDFGREVTFDVVRVREHLPLGQRVEAVALDCWQGGGWREFGGATSIGNARILRSEPIRTSKARLRITKAAGCPAISEVSFFKEPEGVNR